jgi:hypothetical protein
MAFEQDIPSPKSSLSAMLIPYIISINNAREKVKNGTFRVFCVSPSASKNPLQPRMKQKGGAF